MTEKPYIIEQIVTTRMCWNAKYDQQATCKCGHPYERHFDPYEKMDAVGCKYCECGTFECAET